MKDFRSHFVFSRSQQNGIFLLVLIIVVLQLIYFFGPFSSKAALPPEEEEELLELQREIDSLKAVAAAKKDSVEMAPFNPNYISDYNGYLMGMSPEEIDRLHAHRGKELWVNSAEDFQQVTQVSDSLLRKIAPYFKFPEWRQKPSEAKSFKNNISEAPLRKQDLNAATSEDLQQINGIGEKLSARIVKYRESIGGYRGEVQLQDVYGLSSEVIQRLLQRFEVRNVNHPKQDLNSIDIIALSKLPYFNYELARKVVSYRQSQNGIKSFEELGNIPGFPVEKIKGIQLYLAID
ncbi:Helix-hairpin-helix motif-containing protein [Salinimicrobium catena]|uniref:Helix-hairpin-helix motif-containing protein n=1 Tax=Salinimicrobium catena TaxID=390640 RepID=A0A1H5NR91_9FLAO|nr:helix-hairpin-helix domain-containing protein [Salinimicrobium catena]SDL53961.1 Helix-hairpin-helix motif-containing protein [Salinimicrobium catena]SEF04083.1 Helix-hairpin-helix motif-containing protein [Salinimicrobium catena]